MGKKQKNKQRIRGFQKERELVRKLWNLGFACMRAPASGAKVRRSVQPDIIAVRNNVVFVIEVKTRRKEKTIYVNKEQIEKLLEWSKRAGDNAYPFLAVYFDRSTGWRFIPIEKLTKTKSGNYKINLDEATTSMDLLQLKMMTETKISKIDSFIEKNQH